ncbi:general secretion pathway protein GspJ [Alcanivorax hongdengensis A-11-3]|uniref:Type II secretion system protein J n=1 Tax=Alcanivorax hongdengensis A-11-3 TaxID=1177179 RepID=L0WCX1_9GAMM|nr:type II secretion system minor pseudopilin GspJ [Alcanivorax hongdengensis]EKF73590.1 general secretion pathway protein GspJ [Alcanivorax hongdengensis A-11-3]
MSRVRGFTLLEMVITIAIFAIIYIAVATFLSDALRGREQLTESAEKLEDSQRAITYLTLDFEQLIARPVRDPYGDPMPAIIGRDNYVEFTRLGWANPFGLRDRSQMQRVIYSLEDGKLYRRYWPVLDTNVATEYQQDVLLDHVESFTVRYLDLTPQGEWVWKELWPDAALEAVPVWQQRLPKSIEVDIKLETGEEVHRFYRTVVNPWQ